MMLCRAYNIHAQGLYTGTPFEGWDDSDVVFASDQSGASVAWQNIRTVG